MTKFAEPMLKHIVADKMNGVLVAGLLEELNMTARQVVQELTLTLTLILILILTLTLPLPYPYPTLTLTLTYAL